MKRLKKHAHRPALAVFVVVGAIALAGCGSDDSKDSAGTPAPEPATNSASSYTQHGQPNIDAIAAQILGLAQSNGDPRPISAFFVATTLGKSSPVVSGGDQALKSEAGTAVYTFVVGGDFVARAAHPPRGAELPRGKWLIGSLDAKSGELREYGITQKDPTKAVRALGRPVDLGFGPPAQSK